MSKRTVYQRRLNTHEGEDFALAGADSDTARVKCWVYRSARRAETYVYLRERDGFGLLPPALAERLGALTLALELDLAPGRRLAREDVEVVRRNLADGGFHIQHPPAQVHERDA